jgi:hypothetical protein
LKNFCATEAFHPGLDVIDMLYESALLQT